MGGWVSGWVGVGGTCVSVYNCIYAHIYIYIYIYIYVCMYVYTYFLAAVCINHLCYIMTRWAGHHF